MAKKWDETLEALNRKMDELSVKARDAAEKVEVRGQAAREKLDDKIGEARGNLTAAQERFRLASEKGKSKAFSDLLKVQMSVEAAQDSLKAKKAVHDQKKAEDYIEDQIAYATACQELAEVLLANAALAGLEAIAAAAEYEEKYGESREGTVSL